MNYIDGSPQVIEEDTEYLPTSQRRYVGDYTKVQQEENLRRYWRNKEIPDCQKCTNYLFEEQGAFITRRCGCGWRITETEAGPRCFFYKYEFIKEEELKV